MRSPSAGFRSALTAALLATAVFATASAVAGTLPAAHGTPRTAAPADFHVTRKAVSPRVAAVLGPGGELRGMALNDVGAQGRLLPGNIPDLPRLAQEGITSVSIYVYLYVSDQTGNVVSTGAYTPTDAEISLTTQAARAAGLSVQFMPILLNNTDSVWRGYYLPTNIAAFFASYTQQITHYADLAQTLGVKLFYVGSENVFLEPFVNNWKALIATTRRHFTGALSYMTIPLTVAKVKFWRSLDLAAMSAYFSMGDDAEPSYDRDVIAWKQAHLPFVAKFVKTLKIPLIYAETGYSSQAGMFTHPNDSAKTVGKPAPAAQADAYRALLDMLAKTPGVYGVMWWRWQVGSGPADMGFSPAGKPAECVIASHWSPDANIRTIAAQPICDLHTLDAALSALPISTVG